MGALNDLQATIDKLPESLEAALGDVIPTEIPIVADDDIYRALHNIANSLDKIARALS